MTKKIIAFTLVLAQVSPAVAYAISPEQTQISLMRYSPEYQVLQTQVQNRFHQWSNSKKMHFVKQAERILNRIDKKVARLDNEKFDRVRARALKAFDKGEMDQHDAGSADMIAPSERSDILSFSEFLKDLIHVQTPQSNAELEKNRTSARANIEKLDLQIVQNMSKEARESISRLKQNVLSHSNEKNTRSIAQEGGDIIGGIILLTVLIYALVWPSFIILGAGAVLLLILGPLSTW